MAKLYLKFDQSVLKEITLSQAPTTIGRLPDNSVQIDNLAVSGHHARITWEKDHYEIEDLGSLNGTYINNERVGKAKLRHCDLVKIGKHEIEFRGEGAAPVAAIQTKTGPVIPKLENTVLLDTKHAQEMIAAKNSGPMAMAAAATPAKERIGLLSVVEGKTDSEKYILTSKMTMIGKSAMATIKLKGWFAPTSAALISRRENRYFIAPEHKVRLKINGEEVQSQRELAPGDLIEIAKMKAAFSFQD
ncbi:MAG TPA: FHA domain-containing protein [Candidatus Limnocylindrales bacterium]|nr:FHA domain-containing protein [Candidatus Limnocylindrales bacterium]